MKYRIAKRQVLTAGLAATLIFVACSTNFTAHGSEADQAATQRSRLHPKRIFSGIKRGFSRVFRGSEKKASAPVTAKPSVPRTTAPRTTASAQINKSYAKRGVRTPSTSRRSTRTTLASKPKRTTTARPMPQVKPFAPLIKPTASPKIASAPKADKQIFDDWDDEEAVQTTRVRKTTPVAASKISQASARPEQAPEIKHLLGYCAVNLKHGKFLRGKQAYREQFQGRTYAFDSMAALKEFRRNPAPYAPVMQGIDVVELTHTGHHTEGYLSFSCDFDGHFYLFRTQENQEEFLANPSAYEVPE